jgi:hypothetical protein
MLRRFQKGKLAMKTYISLAALFGTVLWTCLAASAQSEQTSSETGIPSHIVVTAEPHKGKTVPTINEGDVMVYEGHTRDKVTEWIPATGDHATLDLFIFIDDSSTTELGTQMDDIRKFIESQPETTRVGVAYMQNGTAQVVQNLTNDHAAAAKSVRLPMGYFGANASPYFSLSDLVKRWPDDSAPRRAVMMISNGIDLYYGEDDYLDPYLQAAIDDCLRAHVMVSAIYEPGVGHYGHSYWATYWGQLYMADVADHTGGEAYYVGFTGAPVAFAPYFDQMANRLSHQYLLTFLAQKPKKADWARIRLNCELPNVDLVGPKRVWVKP